MKLYLSKLADGGVIIFNTTNRYVDLGPVLRDEAIAHNLIAMWYGDYMGVNGWNNGSFPDKFATDYVILQRRDYAKDNAKYNGGPPLLKRDLSDPWKELVTGKKISELKNMSEKEVSDLWEKAPYSNAAPWTDNYSNLFSAMNLGALSSLIWPAVIVTAFLLVIGIGTLVVQGILRKGRIQR